MRDDWYNNLTGNKFKYGRAYLFNVNTRCHCALGVGAATFGIPIDEDGGSMLDEHGHMDGYVPMEDIIGSEAVEKIYEANDRSTNYDEAAEIVKNLPTID